MRTHALFVAVVVLLLSGCSHWPGPEHRDVTLAGVESLIQTHCQLPEEDNEALTDLKTAMADQQITLLSMQSRLDKMAQRPVSQVPPPAPAPGCLPAPANNRADSKLVVGATEWVFLSPPGKYLSARVDTGAETSSISATNIVRFERDGKRWVSFDLDTGNADNDIHLEVPLERNVLIRQASFDDVDRRPVVVFDVKLGSLHLPTEFTLADRSRMSYPVLLGRSFLKDMAVVDVSQEFIHPKSKKR